MVNSESKAKVEFQRTMTSRKLCFANRQTESGIFAKSTPKMPRAFLPSITWQTPTKNINCRQFGTDSNNNHWNDSRQSYGPLHFIPTSKRLAAAQGRQIKHAIYDEITEIFASLPSLMDNDSKSMDMLQKNIDSLKEMINAITQTLNQWESSLLADRRLRSHIFMLAFGKLTNRQQAIYRTLYDGRQLQNHHSIRSLICFLCGQTRHFYKVLNRYNSSQNRQLKETFSYYSSYMICEVEDNSILENEEEIDENASKTDIVYCRYCKTKGHVTSNCPTLKNMVCFKCFKPGHKAKACKTSVVAVV